MVKLNQQKKTPKNLLLTEVTLHGQAECQKFKAEKLGNYRVLMNILWHKFRMSSKKKMCQRVFMNALKFPGYFLRSYIRSNTPVYWILSACVFKYTSNLN